MYMYTHNISSYVTLLKDKACAEVSSEEESDSFEEGEEERSNEQLEEVAEYKRKQRALLEKEKVSSLVFL